MSSIKFDILINDAFSTFCTDPTHSPIHNKWLLTLVNDYELGEWRYDRFLDYIWNNVAETALSKKERDVLIGEPKSIIRRSSKNLRLTDKDKNGQGSEIAEILLYGIMKDYYNALPVVPKIFHKQNIKDNVKGADSVHIVISDDMKDFSLWFGEAKFYRTLYDDDLSTFVASVKDTLDPEKMRKENSIITDLSELDLFEDIPADLKESIKTCLDKDTSLDMVIPKVHIPILLLHQCNTTARTTEMSETYKEKIIEKHKKKANEYFTKQLSEMGKMYKYADVTFHLILFPVPDKETIVSAFIDEARLNSKKVCKK